MKILIALGMALLSLVGHAEVLGEICDHESKIIFELDRSSSSLIVKQDMGYGVLRTRESDIVESGQVDRETHTILTTYAKDLMYGDYYETEDTVFVIAYSRNGVQYVFGKEPGSGPKNYELTGSSKECWKDRNPFSRKFDAYNMPLSTIVMLDRSFKFTNTNDTGVGAISMIFRGGNSKIDYCRFEKQGKDVEPLKGGQTFGIGAVEKQYFRSSPNTKLLEIKLKSEKFGTIACLTNDNVLSLTIGDVFSALESNGVILALSDEYLPGDLATDVLDVGSSVRAINPIVIPAGEKQVTVGGRFGKTEACFYKVPEVSSEEKKITSLASIKSVEDFVNSYAKDDEEVYYSGVNIRFSNGDSLYCVSEDHFTDLLTIHDILRSLNFNKPDFDVFL